MIDTEKSVSRRQVLKQAAVAAGTAALCGIGIKEIGAAPVPETWDLQTDVLVVGSGGGRI